MEVPGAPEGLGTRDCCGETVKSTGLREGADVTGVCVGKGVTPGRGANVGRGVRTD